MFIISHYIFTNSKLNRTHTKLMCCITLKMDSYPFKSNEYWPQHFVNHNYANTFRHYFWFLFRLLAFMDSLLFSKLDRLIWTFFFWCYNFSCGNIKINHNNSNTISHTAKKIASITGDYMKSISNLLDIAGGMHVIKLK